MRDKYTQEQLHAAFTSVQNKKGWKYPVNAVVEADVDQELLTEAIIHFTGSVPEFIPLPNGKIRVKAVGYYIAIGA